MSLPQLRLEVINHLFRYSVLLGIIMYPFVVVVINMIIIE